MEDRWVAVEDAEPEPISESFTCCICLELLYKPVVLSCGHISCFWCVHQSMSGFRETKCPLCRQPYLHFPSICLLLHFLLLKMYPDSYRRREIQTLEEEKRMGTFSPQFDALSWRSGNEEEQKLSGSSQSSLTCLGPNSTMDTGSSRNGEPHASKVQSEPVAGIDGYGPSSPKQDLKRKHDIPVEEENGHLVGSDKSCKQIIASDVLCTECRQLLFHPVALNCGHVYCESCIVYPADEKLTCQVCQSRHPGGLPKVCLELDHFLEQQFPDEYALRRLAARPRLTISENDSPKSLGNSKADSSWSIDTSVTHLGVGCDYCGMYPIIGDRYQCQDCVEKIGFDLCGDCYNSGCKLPGRFNQQHRPEHKFKLKKPNNLRNYMLRLVTGRPDYGSTALIFSNEGLEDGVSLIAPTSLSQEDAALSQEDAENSLSINFLFEDDADSEHQNNSQSNSN
ncbi:E3 ubiquitin-protein ligase PRT1 isoform X2 [Syzygium oleosum]|uniref:E3 ubiquitin-protein ligase PRT1 isoform X2 n=2 Tax=Syzygium oleosum TaxID=219896 RepID=UPI0024B9E046|nr:E3 ubiquitin-protein ligase PRT1 isoform X2 [Syzygium oleosum]